MVQSTVKEQDEYLFEEGVAYEAVLKSVDSRKIEFVYKDSSPAVKAGRAKAGEKGEFEQWRWTFKVTKDDGSTWDVNADTQPGLTSREGDRARTFAETLLKRQFGVGEDFDSDSVVGLPCALTFEHRDPVKKKNGDMGFYCEVLDILPAGSGGAPMRSSIFDEEPPF